MQLEYHITWYNKGEQVFVLLYFFIFLYYNIYRKDKGSEFICYPLLNMGKKE